MMQTLSELAIIQTAKEGKMSISEIFDWVEDYLNPVEICTQAGFKKDDILNYIKKTEIEIEIKAALKADREF